MDRGLTSEHPSSLWGLVCRLGFGEKEEIEAESAESLCPDVHAATI